MDDRAQIPPGHAATGEMDDIVAADDEEDDVGSKGGHTAELVVAHVGDAGTTHREHVQPDRAVRHRSERPGDQARVTPLDVARPQGYPGGVTEHDEDELRALVASDDAVGRALGGGR